ncbi:DUF1501 domain-containing protein [Lichenihabitans psoromatis]|uniref:DUF1501 domain-containing protein n=1 Tax=Lichenihabitans psoromatis TaxID=2528642 RepID=UPI0010355380|nr:DUF1501 domain-containing protein [Lichenihabitans psoromatis]
MVQLCETPNAARRALLQAGGAMFAWAYMPRFALAAEGRDPRLVVIILRGALDGLSAVAPVADPDYAALHGQLALSLSGDHPALPLDGFFALNPAMPIFAALFAQRQAAIVHAVATPYRDRSHFDGQDVLESGQAGPGLVDSGWLNRAMAVLPKGDRISKIDGLAVGATTPLVIRGPAPIVGWAPQIIPVANEDLASRVLALYQARDPRLADSLVHGLSLDRIAGNAMTDKTMRGGMDTPQGMRQAAIGAARLLAAEDGPRVAALAFDGWDTHVNEGGATGRLAQLLGGLDGAIGAFRDGLGESWRDTAIVVATEFGRTVHINGTTGTDHGTGTVAFLAGGAIKGGRVLADWPGLAAARLYQSRDVMPTTDLRSVFKGLLQDHLGLPQTILDTTVLPGSIGVRPIQGLVV